MQYLIYQTNIVWWYCEKNEYIHYKNNSLILEGHLDTLDK